MDVRAAAQRVRLEGSAYGRPMTHEVTVDLPDSKSLADPSRSLPLTAGTTAEQVVVAFA